MAGRGGWLDPASKKVLRVFRSPGGAVRSEFRSKIDTGTLCMTIYEELRNGNESDASLCSRALNRVQITHRASHFSNPPGYCTTLA